MTNNYSERTAEQLIALAGESRLDNDPDTRGQYLHLAEAKMQWENIGLTKRSQEISEKQLDVSNETNTLTGKLLLSNVQASKRNEENAKLMNTATEQLAKSTASLKGATWALVFFTGVQAVIALVALFRH